MVDAQILVRDTGVFLHKRCPEHGWHEALVSSDVDWYLNSAKYNKPGAVPLDLATSVVQGCPYDCGICPEHQQHTCLGLIEVTTRCNLECPTCFADAGKGYDLSLEQVEFILDRFIESEGRPEIVQFSGGEPTIHPRILEMIAAASKRNIRHVMVNTNGLRLAQDADFVRLLAECEPTIYLQFDGLTTVVYERLRGFDLLDAKKKALDNLAEAGLYAILVATIAKGTNDGELGDILRFALDHPAVLGVCYQPVTFAGRNCHPPDPVKRITVPDVLHLLEKQTDGLFQVSDFRPVPCPHPDCSACSYAFIDHGKVIPITRIIDVDDYLDFAVNRTSLDLSEELRSALEALWSMPSVMGTEKTTGALTCAACSIDLGELDLKELRGQCFMVQVHGFMDEYNFDIKRLMKCCVHQLLPDGRAVPFCAYNCLGYRQQVGLEQEHAIGRR